MPSDRVPALPETSPAEVPEVWRKHFQRTGLWFLGTLTVAATVMGLSQALAPGGAPVPLLEGYVTFAFWTVTVLLAAGVLSGLWVAATLLEMWHQSSVFKKRNASVEQVKSAIRQTADAARIEAQQVVEAARLEAHHYLATQRTFEKVVVPDVTASQYGEEVKLRLYVTNEGPDSLTVTDASFRLAPAGTGLPGDRTRFEMENGVPISPGSRGLVGYVTIRGGAVRFRLDEVQITGGLPDRDTMPRSTSRDVLSVHWLTPEPSDAETSSTPKPDAPRP